ncbi:amidase family protein [Bacillus sp. ISL-39]|uniref:amidase family protein n=1 Tax=Bacillus sp. ISL-39 TaxID=2819124 RepID=UPI001BE5C429|nr:amidase family protein [Bacillus sp. ISL-39]MBT2639704.1 amidase [Bacillus sp. ISL-39]
MEGFNYKHYDGLGLAELVKKNKVQPIELVEEAIHLTDSLNPRMNAVINKMYEEARKTAGQPLAGPFAGVPMLLKDISQEIEGQPITAGSRAFLKYQAKTDSEYARRLRQAGVVFLGQTNVPEFALVAVTEPAHYGPTRNPWNLNHTPGGSSGGSAAAVSSGIVPIAGANDGGGSIRIPAAYCGLFGLKPTRGRTPVGPNYGRAWQGASAEHVLTRSVRDSAAMLDALHGHEKAGAFSAAPFEGSYLALAGTPLGKKQRIAFSVKSPIGTEVDADCREGVLKTVRLLEAMGHQIEEVEAPVDGHKIAKSYLTMYFGETAALLVSLEEVLGRKATAADVEPTTWLLGLLGKATSAEEFVLSIREWDMAALKMETFHETYDLYITPTTAYPPAKIGELEPSSAEKFMISTVGKLGLGCVLKKAGIVDQIAQKNLARTPFTQLANLTGQPAMSLPLHQTKDGLPVGVQVMAARGREDLLFQLAGELEQSEFWQDVRKNSLF